MKNKKNNFYSTYIKTKIEKRIISLSIVLFTVLIVILFYFIFRNGTKNNINLTEEEIAWLKSHDGCINIGCDSVYAPLEYIDMNGNHAGIAEDYFRIIESKINIRFNRVNPLSWSDLLQKAKERKIDVVKCAVRTPERSRYLLFTEHYVDLPTVIIVRKNFKDNLTLSQLSGLRIAVTESYSIQEYIKNNYKQIIIIPMKNDAEILKSASSGEVDGVISVLPVASYYIEHLGITNLKIAGETEFTFKLGIGSRSDIPILHNILQKALNSISEEEHKEIAAKWIKLEYKKYLYSEKFWILLIVMAGFILLAIIFHIFWNAALRKLVTIRTQELNDYKNTLEKKVEERTQALQKANEELQVAMNNIKTLSGLMPICASCKKIRDDKGYWNQIEDYISAHSEAHFSHGLCPDCYQKLYPQYYKKL